MEASTAPRDRLVIPSDVLRSFADLLAAFPQLAKVCGGPILRVRVVLDANAVMQDVLLAAKARNATMRPTVEELIDSGVVEALAPELVRREVARHLPTLVARLPDERRARADAVWARYQQKIRWIAETDYSPAATTFPILAARDPNDVPLAAVHRSFGADLIITDDRDLLDSKEVTAVDRTLMRVVRDYARAKATAMAATTVPSFVLTGAVVVTIELFSAIPPRWRIVAAIVAVVVVLAALALASRETRATIWAAIAAVLGWICDAIPAVETAEQHEAEIRRALPPRPPAPDASAAPVATVAGPTISAPAGEVISAGTAGAGQRVTRPAAHRAPRSSPRSAPSRDGSRAGARRRAR